MSAPFRGSTAIAAGWLTPGVLRGPRYQRLFPDVYAPALLEVDLALRARAAGVLVGGRGVVAGYAAAELWGASCGPADAPVDVLLRRRAHDRRCDGLRVRRERIDPDEITWLGPTPITTADRAAFDLARWAPDLTERVAAVDALAHCCKVDLDAVRALRNRHLGVHHGAVIAQVLALADACTESQMEQGDEGSVAERTGLVSPRVGRLSAGTDGAASRRPAGACGAASRDRSRGARYYLDLAYPEVLLAIEYDGAEHRTQRRAGGERRDLMREAALTALGWHILRFDADVVLYRPDRLRRGRGPCGTRRSRRAVTVVFGRLVLIETGGGAVVIAVDARLAL